VGAAVPRLKVGGCRYNSDQIIGLIGKGEKAGIQILVFPELSHNGIYMRGFVSPGNFA